LFEDNKDVAFGDVNLQEGGQGIPGNHNPGAGGWPTIRYFNKKTGYGGASYTKKTSKSMCDELGDNFHMQAYIEEAGTTSLKPSCALDGTGCEDKEKSYIAEWKAKAAAEITAQTDRLKRLLDGSLADAARKWVKQRIAILKQIVAAPPRAEL